jgi:CheY-like chemotaxis protein
LEPSKALLGTVTSYSQDSYSQEKDKQNAMAAGFDFHLVKPVDAAKLAALLAQNYKA